MGISTGLPKPSLRKSERKRAHNDEDNPLLVVNVELRAFENWTNQQTRQQKQTTTVSDDG